MEGRRRKKGIDLLDPFPVATVVSIMSSLVFVDFLMTNEKKTSFLFSTDFSVSDVPSLSFTYIYSAVWPSPVAPQSQLKTMRKGESLWRSAAFFFLSILTAVVQ